MITFQQVSMTFPSGTRALQDVSFEIPDNEFVFLVGPSGAGKTTILRLLLREQLPTTGSVTVNGVEISSNRFSKIQTYRKTIGVIFQDFKVLPNKPVFDNIALSLRVVGYPKHHIQEEVEKALELVGIEHKIHMFPAQLSAGELQRVAIARAIVGDRDILLADEPTGNLDPKTTWEIMKIFKKLEGKKTIILATHNADIVNSMRKRVIVMKNGQLDKDLKKGGYDL